jgi:conjugal transfer pilus assembly protein TraD
MDDIVPTDPLRPVFETRAAAAWLLAFLHGLTWAALRPSPALGLLLAGPALVMLWRRGCAAWARHAFRLRLAGLRGRWPPARMRARLDEPHDAGVWLGRGFRWRAGHARLAGELLARDPCGEAPAGGLHRAARLPAPAAGAARPWIHGLGREGDVLLPPHQLAGHVAALAETEATRSALLQATLRQLVARDELVVVLDAKGDFAREAGGLAARPSHGRPLRFLRWGPAPGTEGIRLAALAGWDRPCRIASRLRLLRPELDAAGVDLLATALSHLVGAMAFVGRRRDIAGLRAVLRSRGSTEALASEAVARFLERRGGLGALGRREASSSDNASPARSGTARRFADPRLAAAVARLRASVPLVEQPPEIAGLLALLEAAPARGLEGVVATLAPWLARLDRDRLRPVLSPDPDALDPRPVLDVRALAGGTGIAWFALAGLGDAAEAVAALVLAELAALAGEQGRRAAGEARADRRIHVLCNDWGALLCEPMASIASHPGAANLVLHLFCRSVSDVAMQAGDARAVLRVLGDVGTLVVGTASDAATAEVVAARSGDPGRGRAGASETHALHDPAPPFIPRELLAGLPQLDAFVILGEGRVHKLRLAPAPAQAAPPPSSSLA